MLPGEIPLISDKISPISQFTGGLRKISEISLKLANRERRLLLQDIRLHQMLIADPVQQQLQLQQPTSASAESQLRDLDPAFIVSSDSRLPSHLRSCSRSPLVRLAPDRGPARPRLGPGSPPLRLCPSSPKPTTIFLFMVSIFAEQYESKSTAFIRPTIHGDAQASLLINIHNITLKKEVAIHPPAPYKMY